MCRNIQHDSKWNIVGGKDNKYYNVRLQTNLLGFVDVVCSWGSVHNKQGAGYKVIPCNTQKDIDLVIQNITKRRNTRGYELYLNLHKKTYALS